MISQCKLALQGDGRVVRAVNSACIEKSLDLGSLQWRLMCGDVRSIPLTPSDIRKGWSSVLSSNRIIVIF